MYTGYRLALRLLAMASITLLLPLFGGDEKKADEKKDDEKWDVASFTDQTYEIDIDTDEGTWMGLDVSPDGKEIVFDMLGDIFTIPMAGGEARLLAGGLPWEMQPRFSPDGKRIAFTSDRGGGDNIWTMARDGSDLQQVTKETFRLLNSPVWSPDGDYIAARKHFTSGRSLGAGEIWLYHKSGGGGIQLIKKPNDQKDLGEPAFSPDGRYVYFSQDTTRGPVFEYSKDPTAGIYSIRRIDRELGDVETLLNGPGGAIRPTPSPDGKHLAFIRRDDYATKLWLHDLESGENQIVYADLDRDMQETWAIHGVYPTIAWTPDGKGLVFWAGGKIHKLDTASKKDSVIPFHVKTKHTMVNVLRRPVEVAPDKFETQMLRSVQVSPMGDRVVYQALGHLYIRDLPDGKARRLTAQTDHFEQEPSWSRDGKQIVYTTWHDQDFGSIRIVPASGGEGKVVVGKKGHYFEPVLSPDGKTLVYQKGGGGFLRSPLWSKDQGQYSMPLDGSAEAVRFSKRGFAYHFAAGSERVYFVTVGAKGKRSLRSIGLTGKDEQEHVTSTMGLELVVSPNGKWLAFAEDWKTYVAPFTATGKVFHVGPGSKNVPVTQVSAETGNQLHWSGDSQRLSWSLGNKLYHRDLKNAFAFVAGAPDELPEPVAEGRNIGFEAEADIPEGAIALVGARIITMKGEEVIEKGTVVVEGNRITAIGRKGKVKIPSGAKQVDVSGKTIIPGLIDVHAHGGHGTGGIIPQQNWLSYAGLAFGVTTIHDPSNDTQTIFAAAEMARTGMILAPRIFSTGTIVYGATAPGATAKINSQKDAALHLRRLKAAGAFSVKSYNQPRRNQRQQVIKAAREENMMVVPEGGSLLQHNLTMIADGHTGIEHSIPPAKIYKDIVQFWSQSDTHYTPTLVVGYGGIWGENYWYDTTEVWKHELLTKYVPSFILEPRSRRRPKAPMEEYNHIRNAEICKQLTDAGVRVNMGAHGQREGLGGHWELWMMGQGGMTPMECLRAGTSNGARYLGLDGDIGSLEVGKLADMVVLGKNPLDNIRNTDSVAQVMLNGRLYDAATMNQSGDNANQCKPFFWQTSGGASPSTRVNVDAAATCHACSTH